MSRRIARFIGLKFIEIYAFIRLPYWVGGFIDKQLISSPLSQWLLGMVILIASLVLSVVSIVVIYLLVRGNWNLSK